jgi:sugar phosphate isomerase/epimerase
MTDQEGGNFARRDILTGAAAGMALTAAGCAPAARESRLAPLAMTDATLRPQLAADYAGTLKKVKAMGYSHFGFRLSGGASEPNAQDKAAMIRDAGLELGPARFAVTGPLEPQIETAAKIGARILALTIAPIFMPRAGKPLGVATRAEVEAYVPQLDAIGAKTRAAGLIFAFHNHYFDLAPLGGIRPLDLFIDRTNPRNVSFEVDLAWTYFAGQDPLALIQRLGRRVVSMHVKDIKRNANPDPTQQTAAPGFGEMNYAALLPKLRRMTKALAGVEVDNPPDGMAAAASGIAFMRPYWKA